MDYPWMTASLYKRCYQIFEWTPLSGTQAGGNYQDAKLNAQNNEDYLPQRDRFGIKIVANS